VIIKHKENVSNVRFAVFTTVTMKNTVFWDVSRVTLVRTDIVFLRSLRRLLVTANIPSPPILVTMIVEAIRSSETSFFQEPHSLLEADGMLTKCVCTMLRLKQRRLMSL
jgi:hypothetical protein